MKCKIESAKGKAKVMYLLFKLYCT